MLFWSAQIKKPAFWLLYQIEQLPLIHVYLEL
jgi:hypothetical protein